MHRPASLHPRVSPHPQEPRTFPEVLPRTAAAHSSADPVTPLVPPSIAATFTAIWPQLHQYLYVHALTEFTSGQGYVKALSKP